MYGQVPQRKRKREKEANVCVRMDQPKTPLIQRTNLSQRPPFHPSSLSEPSSQLTQIFPVAAATVTIPSSKSGRLSFPTSSSPFVPLETTVKRGSPFFVIKLGKAGRKFDAISKLVR